MRSKRNLCPYCHNAFIKRDKSEMKYHFTGQKIDEHSRMCLTKWGGVGETTLWIQSRQTIVSECLRGISDAPEPGKYIETEEVSVNTALNVAALMIFQLLDEVDWYRDKLTQEEARWPLPVRLWKSFMNALHVRCDGA